eukprot:TRINITY_DN509_c0_g1_i2.p1 TRINITY_DN509_c0_g1~~TRINITY_DN509_c0_g1_i2.p1  ORF type:complete len:541 (+),score=170.49 TRINITY_DN509_c0_g1_i2:57-1679(+)
MASVQCDYLNLANNRDVERMLQRNGQRVPKPEDVVLSCDVTKINRKDKEQLRTLLITDAALYNLMPRDYGTMKRRIAIEVVESISISALSDEFVVHVPQEYDYRFKSPKKEEIADTISAQHRKKTGKKLRMVHINEEELKEITVTKAVTSMQDREEILRKRNALAAEEHESDKEDEESSNKSDPLADHEGERVTKDDFEFMKVIGRGSFGKVMQVRKKDTGKIYAMKILKKETIIARNQVDHTRAERLILQSLQHPFLMGLRFAFQTADKLYFVLDYLQGGELFFHLRQKRRFTEEEAKFIVAEIASALGHLHSLDIIYRDLKPENILLDEKGHVCLTDFGLSKDVQENQKAHTFCGTPEYLAPEVVMNVGHTKEVDWWSLGILLYELTVGIPPFYSQNVNEMYQKIQFGVLRLPPFLSDNCKALIIALLHRDPNKRLGSGTRDLDAIKTHPFFSDLDWDRLYRKEIDPPYTPVVQSEADTSNFDAQFTNEPAVDSLVDNSKSKLTNAEDAFQGFTFVPKNSQLNQATGNRARNDDDIYM